MSIMLAGYRIYGNHPVSKCKSAVVKTFYPSVDEAHAENYVVCYPLVSPKTAYKKEYPRLAQPFIKKLILSIPMNTDRANFSMDTYIQR